MNGGISMREFWNGVQVVFTAIGGWLGWFLGGCDGLLYALIAFVVIDYITGISSPIGTAICTPNKKVMENGQVMIYRNGRRYNTLGVGTELDF